MDSKEMKFQISNSVVNQIEVYANQTNLSIDKVVDLIFQWTMKELESQLEVVQSKFEQKQLEWVKTHLDLSDLLSVSHSGALVHLLKKKWSNSSFEEEIDLSNLFRSLLTLTEQELFILSWWIAKT